MTNSQHAEARTGVLIGSTRPGRRGPAVAHWVTEVAGRHPAVLAGTATVEVVDLAERSLPLLDEPVPAVFGEYRHAHTRRWAATVGALDAFVVVTPEYNHSVPAALKNAVDHLYAEWNGKVAGLVGYGVQGGTRAVDHLRQVLAEVRVAVVPTQLAVPVFDDFDFSGFDADGPTAARVFAPGARQEPALTAMLDEVVGWTRSLRGAANEADRQPAPAWGGGPVGDLERRSN